MTTNLDQDPHTYTIATRGVDFIPISVPAPIHLDPGESEQYEIRGVYTRAGKSAVVAFAYSETGVDNDGRLGTALFGHYACSRPDPQSR